MVPGHRSAAMKIRVSLSRHIEIIAEVYERFVVTVYSDANGLVLTPLAFSIRFCAKKQTGWNFIAWQTT